MRQWHAADRGRISHTSEAGYERDLYAKVSARIVAELEAGRPTSLC
jgi:hypothetical protein